MNLDEKRNEVLDDLEAQSNAEICLEEMRYRVRLSDGLNVADYEFLELLKFCLDSCLEGFEVIQQKLQPDPEAALEAALVSGFNLLGTLEEIEKVMVERRKSAY